MHFRKHFLAAFIIGGLHSRATTVLAASAAAAAAVVQPVGTRPRNGTAVRAWYRRSNPYACIVVSQRVVIIRQSDELAMLARAPPRHHTRTEPFQMRQCLSLFLVSMHNYVLIPGIILLIGQQCEYAEIASFTAFFCLSGLLVLLLIAFTFTSQLNSHEF